jgi:tetratricopeptide (TPR) repeat protein
MYAEQSGDGPTREKIWTIITNKWPKDPLAWQGLARFLFNQTDYCGAKKAIETFFHLCSSSYETLTPGLNFRKATAFVDALKQNPTSSCLQNKNLYETLYEYGQILKREFHFWGAKDCFQQARDFIDQVKEPSFEMEEYRALIEFSLGNNGKCFTLFKKLYELSSYDATIGSTYMNLLMNRGDLHKVRKFFKSKPSYQEEYKNCHIEKSTFESSL